MDAVRKRLLQVALLVIAFGTLACGGSTEEAKSPRYTRRLLVDLPVGWHGTEAPAIGTVDKKAFAALDPAATVSISIVVYPTSAAPPQEHIAALRKKLLREPNTKVEDPSIMYNGTYAKVQWCDEGLCHIEAVRQTLDDPGLVLVMRAVWNKARTVKLGPVEDLFRTAEFR